MYSWEELLIVIVFEALVLIIVDFDLSIFNPIRNYNAWVRINWFGIIIITLLFNIIFIGYAICYWIYKLFTIGRK